MSEGDQRKEEHATGTSSVKDFTKGQGRAVTYDFGLVAGRGLDEVVVEDIEDVVADVRELLLDLAAVVANAGDVGLVLLALLLLLNGRDDPPRSTAGTDDVLVSDGEQVALLHGELDIELGDVLHGRDHLIVALSLRTKG